MFLHTTRSGVSVASLWAEWCCAVHSVNCRTKPKRLRHVSLGEEVERIKQVDVLFEILGVLRVEEDSALERFVADLRTTLFIIFSTPRP